jgi:hypothetical protein
VPSSFSFSVWTVPARPGETEPPAEPAQRLQLGARQHAHLAHEPRHVAGEDLGDEPPAAPRQRHGDEAAIVPPASLRDEPAPDEVGHDHRGVAVAAEQLEPEVALAERTVVEQGLQHAELPDGEAGGRHHAARAGGQRLAGPHQLDVGVQGGLLERGASVARGHGSNSKGLYARPRAVVKPPGRAAPRP